MLFQRVQLIWFVEACQTILFRIEQDVIMSNKMSGQDRNTPEDIKPQKQAGSLFQEDL